MSTSTENLEIQGANTTDKADAALKKTKMVSQVNVNQAMKALNESPEKADKDIPLVDAIEKLYPEIMDMQKKGYSWDDISGILKQHNLDIRSSTLRTYIYSIRKKKKESEDSKVDTSAAAA